MSTVHERILLSLPARSPDVLIGELQALRDKARAGQRVSVPLTTFHLRSGRDVTGWLLNASFGRPAQWSVLLQQRPLRVGDDLLVTYLEACAVEAITVHNPLEVAPHLSGGTGLGPVLSEPAPLSRLALRRRLHELGEALHSAVGLKLELSTPLELLPDDTSLLGHVGLLASDLVEVLSAVARDELGRAAVAQLSRLVLEQGEPGVHRVDQGLVVRARFADAWAGRLTKEELKVAIEKLL